jgi:hypothetical protein
VDLLRWFAVVFFRAVEPALCWTYVSGQPVRHDHGE